MRRFSNLIVAAFFAINAYFVLACTIFFTFGQKLNKDMCMDETIKRLTETIITSGPRSDSQIYCKHAGICARLCKRWASQTVVPPVVFEHQHGGTYRKSLSEIALKTGLILLQM